VGAGGRNDPSLVALYAHMNNKIKKKKGNQKKNVCFSRKGRKLTYIWRNRMACIVLEILFICSFFSNLMEGNQTQDISLYQFFLQCP
jgi:hypothetical protein